MVMALTLTLCRPSLRLFIIHSSTKANRDEFDLTFLNHVMLQYYSRNMTRYALLIALNAAKMELARTLPLKSIFHNKRVLKGFNSGKYLHVYLRILVTNALNYKIIKLYVSTLLKHCLQWS